MADCKVMLETLADPNPDALMRTVIVVRRMLIDGNPLVHQVNKNFRLSIVFSVKDVGVLSPGVEDIFQRYEAVDIDASFDPDLGANVPTSEVKLSDFLRV